VTKGATLPLLRIDDPEVILRGVLGFEVLIADEGIVEVIEGRHAEDPLVEAT
jgi:hypothetical protein